MKKMSCLLVAALFPVAVIADGSHGDMHKHDEGHGMKEAINKSHGNDSAEHVSTVGKAGKESEVTRTIEVDLLDTMRFEFRPSLSIKRGDVVRLVITNRGNMRHEFSIGNESEQNDHRAMMRSMPGMMHQDANRVTVDPGKSTSLIWRFDGEEDPVFACNIPGHSEAGMIERTQLLQERKLYESVEYFVQ